MENKISFFVIEDHALTNLGIQQILKDKAGLVCKGSAAEKAEAFEKLAKLDMKGQLPQILILDLYLGEYSGIDILREVSLHFPSIKTIVYSMYSNPGVVTIVIEAGAKAFVSKAGAVEELLHAVEKVSAGELYIQKELTDSLEIYKNLADSLTKNERAILNKLLERKTKSQVAQELEMNEISLDNYLFRVYAKTGCKNHEELIARFG
ncbi:MAG: response regulator transcription factor [Treponema sp.]|nr:response regulator transcription factor [Treponema sp.]